MKHRYSFWVIVILTWSCTNKETDEPVFSFDPASYVNPFIGTGGKGKTFPGATVPFGMVQLSPDNGRGGWDYISGYYYPDSIITGFSHTHLSGTGIGDLYDISFMPITYPLPAERSDTLAEAVGTKHYSHFSHDKEKAIPGYYQVYLKDYGIEVALTATDRSGIQKYTVEDNDSLKVFLNLGYSRNWDATTNTYIEVVSDSLITGYRFSTGWAPDQRVYFASLFSTPFDRIALYANDSLQSGLSARGKTTQLALTYSNSPKEIIIKTGISSVSIKNAVLNLNEESRSLTFEAAKNKAYSQWNRSLQKIMVKSSDQDHLTSFYTALYQSMLAPTLFSDVNGDYRGADRKTHQTSGYNKYSTFSLWDTFRAQHPLLTITNPDKVDDFINSMLSFYDEYGYLPVWDLAGNETNMMIGYHAVPVIADAYLKGFTGFNISKAYEAMKKSAEANHFGLKDYKKYGYVPAKGNNESVSLTLEYAFDDWCIAQVAKKLDKEEDYKTYINRASAYQHLFDESTNFMRAKDSLGNWKTPFQPTLYNSGDYIEANAWHYTWFVPHEPEKLAQLMGGKKKFRVKLDSLFTISQSSGPVPEWISGYIGQYVHGNEPCHHIPYLYNYTDQPWKTGIRVREIIDKLYKNEPAGLCGNEDCGQMSAWYIFSALGLYPLNPASGYYELGTPLFETAIISVGENEKLVIGRENYSDENKYVTKIMFNGNEINSKTISHAKLIKGGALTFIMGPKPGNYKIKNY